MNLQATETYERTWDAFQEKFNKDEYAKLLADWIEEELPGVPSIYRYNQIVSMGGSRSSKSYSILQLLLLEMVNRKGIKITKIEGFDLPFEPELNVAGISALAMYEAVNADCGFEIEIYKNKKLISSLI